MADALGRSHRLRQPTEHLAALPELDVLKRDIRTAVKEKGPGVQCAALMLLRTLTKYPKALGKAALSGSVTIIHVPGPEWTNDMMAAWKLALDVATAGRSQRLNEARHAEEASDELLTPRRERSWRGERDTRKPIELIVTRRSLEANIEVLREVAGGMRPLYAVSNDPERFLPSELVLAADSVLMVDPPDQALLRTLALQVTGRRETPKLMAGLIAKAEIGGDIGAVSPALVVLARRPGQSPFDYLRRLVGMSDSLMAARERARPSRKGVTLEELHGLGAASQWGLETAADLQAFRRGELPWSDVDRGILLVGPPGCGKTTFASALATSAKVDLVAASLSEWQGAREGHLGTLLGAMRATFDEARRRSPCVLLIDEVDSFPSRTSVKHEHRDYVVTMVNGFLEQLDGISGREGVVIIGACNDASNLDPAMVRSGRLERIVTIGLPDADALILIMRGYLGVALAGENLLPVAQAAYRQNAVGADLERWCRGARRRARLAGRDMSLQDLMAEVAPPQEALPAELMRRIAIHEAGHALAYTVLWPGTLVEVRIGHDGQSGGHTLTMGVMSSLSDAGMTRDGVLARLQAYLAGRAAEEELLGSASGGAGGSPSSDLGSATRLASVAVCMLGLDDHPNGLLFRGDGADGRIILGDRELRVRVAAMLRTAFDQVRALVAEHRQGVLRVAHELLRSDCLQADEVDALLFGSGGAPVMRSDRIRQAVEGIDVREGKTP